MSMQIMNNVTINSEYTRFFLNIDENENWVPCVEPEFVNAACEYAKKKLNRYIDLLCRNEFAPGLYISQSEMWPGYLHSYKIENSKL